MIMLRVMAFLLLVTPGLALAQQQAPDQATIDEYLESADPDAPLIIRDPFGTNNSGVGLESQTQQPAEPMAAPGADDVLRAIENGAVESTDLTRADPLHESFDAPMVDAPRARLRGLDTLTNTANDFEIAVGETLAFKRLIVTLEACRHPEGEVSAEAYAYLRIRDRREQEERFSGWMLASSPALSALDHPRYDVWVLSCSTD